MDSPILFFITPFVWISGWIVASVIYRRFSDKPIIPRVPLNAVFYEDWRSGRSLRNVFTRFGGASNCLLIYVRGGELIVTPRFPFTLMFLPEVYGLDVRVRLSEISTIEPIKTFFGSLLRVTFRPGGPPTIELSLKDEDAFVRSLGSAITAAGAGMRPLRTAEKGKGYRLVFARGFAAIWGAGALYFSLTGLQDDVRYRMHGVKITAVFDGHTGTAGQKGDMGILSYSVKGQKYRLTSLQGNGMYKFGNEASVYYLPNNPADAREAAYLPFDLLFLGLGTIAMTFALFIGKVIGNRR